MLQPGKWRNKPLGLLFKAVDTDNSGALDIEELLEMVFGNSSAGVESESDPEASSSSSEEEFDNLALTKHGSKASALNSTLKGVKPGTPTSPIVKGTSRGSHSRRSTEHKSGHLSRKLVRSEKYEEPSTTKEELYELLTMTTGVTSGKLKLDDMIETFVESKLDGLGPKLANLITQQVEGDGVPEDISGVEVLHLYSLVLMKPEATAEEARQCISDVKDECRAIDIRKRPDRQRVIKEKKLALDAPIGFKMFCKLLELLGCMMRIDEPHMLAVFAWTRTNRFEMTETMAVAIMSHVFLKTPKDGGTIMEQPITENDFVRMCYSMNLIDNAEKTGFAHGKLGLIFGKLIKNLPRLVLERENRRYRDRDMAKAVKPRKRKHHHRSIIGCTQMAILLEELYKAFPSCRSRWRSPHNLVLHFMETGTQEGGRQRLK
jgi:Ca2+-binding EF-hand superfamily protein